MGCKHFSQHLLRKYNKNKQFLKKFNQDVYTPACICFYTQHTCGFIKKKFKQKEKFLTKRCHESEKDGKCGKKKSGSEQQIKNQQKFPFAFILYDLKHISHFTIFLFFPFFFAFLSWVMWWWSR